MEEKYLSVCFVSLDKDSLDKVYDYLFLELKLDETSMILIDNTYYIFVYDDNYKKAVINGHRFIVDNNIKDVFWCDYSYSLVKCGSLKTCLLTLPDKRRGSVLWGIDDKLPKDIYTYLRSFKKYVGGNDLVFQEYYSCEDEKGFIIYINGMDYNKYMKNMVSFVRKYGLGPFTGVIPMTEYGEYLEMGTYSKVRKK
jgi:hypothetical protein